MRDLGDMQGTPIPEPWRRGLREDLAPRQPQLLRDLTILTFGVRFSNDAILRRLGPAPAVDPDLTGGFEFVGGLSGPDGRPLAIVSIWLDGVCRPAEIAPRRLLARYASTALGGEGANLLVGGGEEGVSAELRREGRVLISADLCVARSPFPATGQVAEVSLGQKGSWCWAAELSDARPEALEVRDPAIADLQPAEVFAASLGRRAVITWPPAPMLQPLS